MTWPELRADPLPKLVALPTPNLTVVIPVYNGERYIRTAIESVLAQTGCTFELIVVDDGSTDGTSRLIQSYRSRLRYFRQENRGVSQARNYGIEQAQGQYVAFLDADDYCLPHKLAHQLALFQQNPELGIVHSGWQRVDAVGALLGEVCPWQRFPDLDLTTWLLHKPVLPSAMMFKRQWLIQVGGLDPRLAAAEDVDLVWRLAIAGCKSQWLRQVTTAYRQHGQSAMGNGQVQADCLAIVLDKAFSHPRLPTEARLIECKVRYSTLVWAAWYLYRTGHPEAMAERLLQAYGLAPTLPTLALTEWVESFVNFAKNLGEVFDLAPLIYSTPWLNLKAELMGKNTTAKPIP